MNCRHTTPTGRTIHHGWWIIAFLCFSPSVAQGGSPAEDTESAREASSPHLALVWNDPYRGLPHTYKTMKREVERIFNDVGIDVRMEKRGLEIRRRGGIHETYGSQYRAAPVGADGLGKGRGSVGV